MNMYAQKLKCGLKCVDILNAIITKLIDSAYYCRKVTDHMINDKIVIIKEMNEFVFV